MWNKKCIKATLHYFQHMLKLVKQHHKLSVLLYFSGFPS